MIFILLGLLVLAALALYQGLTVKRYTVSSPKLRSETRLRLCLITDLHSVCWGKNQQKLLRKVRQRFPDAVLLGGDIWDDKFQNANPPVHALIEGLPKNIPCFYVTGSHDIWTWRRNEQETWLKAHGVTVLHNETQPLTLKGETLFVCGVDEPAASVEAGVLDETTYYHQILNNLERPEASAFHLLMAHRPEFFAEYARLGFDLVVSGHCHGGQVRFPPLLKGLFAPGQGLFPKYVAGRYQLEQTTLIVSRGLHIAAHLPRIFNPPQVVEIILKGA